MLLKRLSCAVFFPARRVRALDSLLTWQRRCTPVLTFARVQNHVASHASCTCHTASLALHPTQRISLHTCIMNLPHRKPHYIHCSEPRHTHLDCRTAYIAACTQSILDSLITCGMICVEAARERAEKLVVVAQRTQKAVTPFLKTRSETIPDEE